MAAAVWIVGDISYATGYLAVWEWWLHMVSPWIGRLPTLFGVGNHESGALQQPLTAGPAPANHYSYFSTNDAGGECGIVTTALLPLPSTGTRSAAASADAPYWALATGPFLLITLSSEHAFFPGSLQLQWLETTLASANRTLTPFVLLGCHRPMYIDSTYATDGRNAGSPDTGDTPVAASLQAHVEPLTMKYKVTLALYGHNHAVQRLTPAYRNASVQHSTSIPHSSGVGTSALFLAPPATLHMVIGTGGAGFTRNCAACSASAPLPPPSFSERVFYAWGALRITARNASTLELDWVDSGSGQVLDSVTLVQDLEKAWADEGGGGGGAQARPGSGGPQGCWWAQAWGRWGRWGLWCWWARACAGGGGGSRGQAWGRRGRPASAATIASLRHKPQSTLFCSVLLTRGCRRLSRGLQNGEP